jgi:eukaryotic-like serine/threonine-protein kinase
VIGKVIADRYRIDEMISEGAMGRVYLAHHARLSKRFAVKILFGDLASQRAMRDRFAQEAEAASRLEHRNLVSVVDFGESETGLLYLVMEYIEGRTLDRLLREEGPFTEERAIRIAHDLCRGLRHLHARGLIHRDLKLENVVVVHDRDVEVPKIVDFGIALLPVETNARLTRAGAIVGTPAFMAPEQAFGDAVDARADLFSLGIVLYHLLVGCGPFEGNAFELIQKMVTAPIPPFRERNPKCGASNEIEAIVMRLLARQPNERPESAQALIDALEALPGQRTWSASSNVIELPPVEARRSRWPWIASGVAVAGIVAGIAMVGMRRAEAPLEARTPSEAQAPIEATKLVEVVPPAPPEEPEPPPPKAKKKKMRSAKKKRAPSNERPPVQDKLMPLSSDVDTKTRIALEPAALAASYQQVGKMIERLAEKRGSTAAAPYRLRHVAIPLPASLKTDAERTQVARQLSALQRDLAAELRR